MTATTFGLVHAAWHGAWCWDRLVPELEGRGFPCVAVDLPTRAPSCGGRESALMMHHALDDAGDVVLVGHSLGGLVIPILATLRPVRLLVYLAPFVPEPGRSMAQQLAEGTTFAPGWPALASRQIRHPDGAVSWPEDAAVDAFYHDCTPEDARWAAGMLRPQVWTLLREPAPPEGWPAVDSVAIACLDDRVLDADRIRQISRERFGKPALEIPGGHCPFLARPPELAALLAGLAAGATSGSA
ncbi:MAG: alpha/beta hydrolase [Actinomycetota bacterium]